jgi:hypothetical protein
MHTKDKLAAAMIDAGIPAAMVERARDGYYHDFLSPLDFPELVLADDLNKIGTPKALSLRQRVIDGEFDASFQESEDWARSPEGKDAFARLVDGKRK